MGNDRFYIIVYNSELAHVAGSILDGKYYFEAAGSNIHYFDLSNPSAPPGRHGINVLGLAVQPQIVVIG